MLLSNMVENYGILVMPTLNSAFPDLKLYEVKSDKVNSTHGYPKRLMLSRECGGRRRLLQDDFAQTLAQLLNEAAAQANSELTNGVGATMLTKFLVSEPPATNSPTVEPTFAPTTLSPSDAPSTVSPSKQPTESPTPEGNQPAVCQGGYSILECPAGYTVHVKHAFFGRNDYDTCGKSPTLCEGPETDASTLMREHCEGKQLCTSRASTDVFADPCPNILKFLTVAYDCTNGAETIPAGQTAPDAPTPAVVTADEGSFVVCERDRLVIDCPEDKPKISLLDVQWGRFEGIEACGSSSNLCEKKSYDDAAYNYFSPRCAWNHCDVLLSASRVGSEDDKCPGVEKYLTGRYSCEA